MPLKSQIIINYVAVLSHLSNLTKLHSEIFFLIQISSDIQVEDIYYLNLSSTKLRTAFIVLIFLFNAESRTKEGILYLNKVGSC
jgi:hypothetical protein